MVKKTKSKQRLDVFYRLAKEQGFRSRAAFKLIQLNKKYNFLQDCKVVVDLCAAPGGWMQVCSKYMAPQSLIIGVDLDPIKSVPNCIGIQADITTQNCMDQLQKHMKHVKADAVLNDGAPNVGANWSKDAYNQSELVMYSLKLATQILKKNGTFVTKIFRSSDYQNLIWLFGNFFKKVEANKPMASRNVSAEIFLVCQGYLAPDKIDPKFFDPSHVFDQTEADLQKQQEMHKVNSIQKIFQKNRREIIKDNAPLTMFSKATLQNFIDSENPYEFIKDHNAIDIQDREFFTKISGFSKVPANFEDNLKDLKLLGKKEVTKILKFRTKVKQHMKNEEQGTKEINKDKKQIVNSADEENAFEKLEKKKEKQEKKMRDKQILKFVKTKMITKENIVDNVIDQPELENFSFTKYQKVVNEGKYKDLDKLNEDDFQEAKDREKKKKKEYMKDLNENIEKEYEKKLAKEKVKEISTEVVDQLRKKKIKKDKKVFDKEKKQTVEYENDTVDFSDIKKKIKFFQKDIFNVLDKEKIQQKIIPGKESQENEEENSDSDGEIIGKKKKKLDYAKLDQELESSSSEEENIIEKIENDDELAEIRAISKKMLRKKDRRQIIDDSFNRYNYPEDPQELPKWFYEDEKKNIGKIPMVTKEEVLREKETMRVLKARLPKKVMEAKMRQKKKFIHKITKARSQAQEIFDNDNYNSFSKARQINDLYKKVVKTQRPKKKDIIVAKKHTIGAPRKKKGRKFQVVDSRQRKDLRAQKRREKTVGRKKKVHKNACYKKRKRQLIILQ